MTSLTKVQEMDLFERHLRVFDIEKALRREVERLDEQVVLQRTVMPLRLCMLKVMPDLRCVGLEWISENIELFCGMVSEPARFLQRYMTNRAVFNHLLQCKVLLAELYRGNAWAILTAIKEALFSFTVSPIDWEIHLLNAGFSSEDVQMLIFSYLKATQIDENGQHRVVNMYVHHFLMKGAEVRAESRGAWQILTPRQRRIALDLAVERAAYAVVRYSAGLGNALGNVDRMTPYILKAIQTDRICMRRYSPECFKTVDPRLLKELAWSFTRQSVLPGQNLKDAVPTLFLQTQFYKVMVVHMSIPLLQACNLLAPLDDMPEWVVQLLHRYAREKSHALCKVMKNAPEFRETVYGKTVYVVPEFIFRPVMCVPVDQLLYREGQWVLVSLSDTAACIEFSSERLVIVRTVFEKIGRNPASKKV